MYYLLELQGTKEIRVNKDRGGGERKVEGRK